MFYIHPWEIDVDQPRIRASTLTTWRHYGGLRKTMPRLERMLSEYSFGSVEMGLPQITIHGERGPHAQMPEPG
jgi:hypothetical protein